MHFITAKSILSSQNGMNLCRGCLHGCIYCDSRSSCYRMAHAFTDIAVKRNALCLLERALRKKRAPCMIGTGSMSDPYQPLAESLALTRGALELLDRYGFGATLITKSDRVLGDLDLFRSIHSRSRCVVQMTLTTHDDALCRLIEPNVCPTSARVTALCRLREAGIPTVVWLSPILPYLNDTAENIEALLASCAAAGVWGVVCFGMGLTLREGSREYFYDRLDRLFPGLRERYERRYGSRYIVESPRNGELMSLFHARCDRYGIVHDNETIFRFLRAFPGDAAPEQMSFWKEREESS